jgi:beta-lactamase regulating signal transducer with metallopeptidase domain
VTERPNVLLAALLSLSAVFAVILAGGLLFLGAAGVAELVAMVVGSFSACVYFLAELRRVPITALTLVVLVVLSGAAFLRALLVYCRQRSLLKRLPLEPIGGELARIARAAGAAELYRTPARRPAAFCFGLRRPCVVVTQGLLDQLDPDEQAAAVWHEAQHARVREPLKCLVARLAAQTFFWLPVVHDLLERYLLVKELDADRLAAARTSRRALAGALYEVIGAPTPAGAVGLADYAASRVDRLFDEHSKLPTLTRPLHVGLTVVATIALALTVLFPARLEIGESSHLQTMLTSMSLHGLPGMAAGFAVNALILTCMALSARRLLRAR